MVAAAQRPPHVPPGAVLHEGFWLWLWLHEGTVCFEGNGGGLSGEFDIDSLVMDPAPGEQGNGWEGNCESVRQLPVGVIWKALAMYDDFRRSRRL